MMETLEAVSSSNPWLHRCYLKDGKIRVRERYFRTYTDQQTSTFLELPDDTQVVVIPDTLTLRKYLPCIQYLLKDNEGLSRMQWVLLESVVEYLDFRNQAPIILVDKEGNRHHRKEMAAPQERQILQRLCQDCDSLHAFCDLSLRQATDDEWDILEYERMTVQQRSANALIRAGHMIQDLFPSFKVVIISENANTLDTDEDELEAFTMKDFVSFMESELPSSSELSSRLLDLMITSAEIYESRNKPMVIAGGSIDSNQHWTSEQVQAGIRAGELHVGRLVVTEQNVREAYVSVGSQKWFVDVGRGRHNRAFHSDVVVIRPLPAEEWGRPVGRQRLVAHSDNSDENNNNIDFEAPPFPSAEVVSIQSAGRRVFVATLIETSSNEDSTSAMFVPMDIRIPKIRVSTKQDYYLQKRALVQIDDWEVGSSYPKGHCQQVLGGIGNLETEITALLHEAQVDLQPFSLAALACLPSEGEAWTVPKSEIARRRDLRSARHVFSVDPPGCQDIDDAMHAEVLPNGDIEIGVHIADVTHFVKHDSPLDLEAQARGTTVYLVDRRFDMLPSLLSSNLCSLHGGVDRLAVSVIWVFSAEDFKTVKSTWYGTTVIHNCAAMTYDQADQILKGENPASSSSLPPLTAGGPVDTDLVPSLRTRLRLITTLARKLKRDREVIGGAVDLSSGDVGSELKFSLSNGVPTTVSSKEDKEIHHTIAELMIMANSTVAEKIHKKFPTSALLRIHQSVDENRFEELSALLEATGISFDGTSNKALADSLKRAEGGGSSFVQGLLKSLATRAMSEARYICTDGSNESQLIHYGLGLGKYTHFTSPIRRYADVVVHKQLLVQKAELAETKEKVSTPAIALPPSEVMSVLNDGELQDVGQKPYPILATRSEPVTGFVAPYKRGSVQSITERLNIQNRIAKQASFDCQRLFLSLFFKSRSTVERGIVTDVRANGVICYVPKFDIRAPMFLQDQHGVVQMDPSMLGLPSEAGFPATSLFSLIPEFRRIPSAKLDVVDKDSLEISVKGSGRKMAVRVLDEVSIRILTSDWDVRARIPQPRLYLVSGERPPLSLGNRAQETAADTGSMGNPGDRFENSLSPLYSNMLIKLSPRLRQAPRSKVAPRQVPRTESLSGRIVFRDFINPDLRSTVLKASQENAALQAAARRAKIASNDARAAEYDTTRRIQLASTSRQQRLAAGKRNTRHSKKS